MREILFRGQKVGTKEWVYGDLIHGVGFKKGKIFILPIMENLAYAGSGCHPLDGFEVVPESVGQFTGKSDKNDIKVFNDDWIRVCAGYVPKIIWDDNDCCFLSKYDHPEDPEGLLLCDIDWSKAEVVGNIHDNSEMP